MKNKIKHIIALFLVIMMSFQMAAFVAADETVAIEEDAAETLAAPVNLREYQILDALGVFEIYYDEEYTGYSELTRAEAASVSARMLGIGDGHSMEGKEMPYSDVSGTDTYAYEIYHVTNLGIMNGYAGEFNPNGIITEEQFVKVLVETLGYRAEAQAMGGYPHGYTITAGKYHVLDGIEYKGNVPLTAGVAVRMVYNAVTVEMPNFIAFGNGGFVTTVGNTVMSQYLDVTKSFGILQRTSTTFLGNGDPAKEGVVQIGNEYYYAGDSNCEQYLGYNVEFFYKKTAEDDLGTILYAAPWSNETLRLEADEISDYVNREYKYYVGNAIKTVKVPAGADVLYNGKPIKKGSYKPTIGYVDLIDNDIDGDVEVVSITSYDVYEIKANNTFEYTLTTEDGKQIKGYDKASWNVVDVYGESLPAVKVVKGNILLLAVSEDATVIKGFQVNEQIEGTFQSKYIEGAVQHVIINDTDYRVHPYCADDYKTIKLGDYVGFYVYKDMLLIKCLPASSLTESVGYLIEMGSTSGLESKVMARMMFQTGEVKVVTVNEKAKLVRGANTYKDPTQFKNLLTYTLEHYASDEAINEPAGTPETTVHQPIIYKLNEAGEVIFIEASTTHNYNEKIVPASDEDGFNLVYMVRDKYVRHIPAISSVNATGLLLDKDTIVIDLPTDLENYNAYKVYKFSDMPLWDTGAEGRFTNPYRFYRTGNDILGANIMVGSAILGGSAGSAGTFILDKIAEGITDDGVECYILSGKTTAFANVSVKTTDKSVVNAHTSPSITIGDLISYSKDSFGLVDSITIRYDRETATVLSNSASYLGATGTYNVGGQVYKITNDSMAYYGGVIPDGATLETQVSDGTTTGPLKDFLRYFDITGCKYVIFDSTLDRADSHLIEASLGEVKTYVEDPLNVSTFVATKEGTAPGIFVIYK